MTKDKTNTEIITGIQIKNYYIEQVKKFYYFGNQNTNENTSIKEDKNRIVVVKLAFHKNGTYW